MMRRLTQLAFLVMLLIGSLTASASPISVGIGSALDRWTISTWAEPLETGAVVQFWRKPTLLVTPAASAPSAEVLLATADEYLGVPYVWGGVSPNGFDCSGFTNAVYARHGYDLPRVSGDQFKVGVEINRSGLLPGDLLFFSQEPGRGKISHVAIYVGDETFIHAARGKAKVTYDRLTSNYYTKRFRGARRMLTLPPGKYSNHYGGPLDGKLFASQRAADRAPPPDKIAAKHIAKANDATGGPSSDAILAEWGMTGSGDAPVEDSIESKPAQFAAFNKGAVSSVGPTVVSRQETALGLRTALGAQDGVRQAFLVPYFTYFGHDDAFELNLGVPLVMPLAGIEGGFESYFQESWDEVRDYTKVIRDVRYGQKESNLYIALSRQASATLGHGTLVRYTTPNLAMRNAPGFVVEPDALSLEFDWMGKSSGIEIFADDLFSPSVAGFLMFARPHLLVDGLGDWTKRASGALTIVADPSAPVNAGTEKTTVLGIGLDAEFKYYKSPRIDLKAYVDASSLLSDELKSAGFTVGTLARMNFAGRRVHVVRSRFEYRYSSADYIPGYFGTDYRLARRAPFGGGPTRLDRLIELEGAGMRQGVLAELIYHYTGLFSGGVLYEASKLPQIEDETLGTGNFMAHVAINDLYIPGSRRSVQLNASYHLRDFKTWGRLADLRRENEYLALGFQASIFDIADLGVSVRKGPGLAVSEVRPVGWDVMLSASFGYEL